MGERAIVLALAYALIAALLSALVAERISPIRRGLLLLLLLIGSWLLIGSLALLVHVWLELSETALAMLLFGGTGLLRRGAPVGTLLSPVVPADDVWMGLV